MAVPCYKCVLCLFSLFECVRLSFSSSLEFIVFVCVCECVLICICAQQSTWMFWCVLLWGVEAVVVKNSITEILAIFCIHFLSSPPSCPHSAAGIFSGSPFKAPCPMSMCACIILNMPYPIHRIRDLRLRVCAFMYELVRRH